jgi:hypothetical protein
MAGGSKGLLQNSTDLCASTNRAISEFTAHNGKVSNTNPVLKPLGCHQRHKKGKGHGKHKRHR